MISTKSMGASDNYSFGLLLLLAVILSSPLSSSSSTSSNLRIGSSLSVEHLSDTLLSPNGAFSAGFFPVGENAYCFAIWFTEPTTPAPNLTVVWMANRDQPVNGHLSKLSLQRNGNLILTDAGKSTVWSSNTVSNSLVQLLLHDTGNLVLLAGDGVVLWESFASPTNTLLPYQPLTRNTRLVSSRSLTNSSSGFYKLFFDNDNTLRLLYDGPEVSSIYWPDPWLLSYQAERSSYNNSRIAMFDALGHLSASDDYTVLSSDYRAKVQRIVKVDVDGNVRMYSRKKPGETWGVTWQAISQPCKIHGLCGANSWCTYNPSMGRKCSCLPGYKVVNKDDWSYGCEPDFNRSCDAPGDDRGGFVHLPRVEMYGFDFGIYYNTNLQVCKTICLGLCNCTGFHHKYDWANQFYNCYPKSQLRNGFRSPNFDGDLYLKLPKSKSTLSSDDVRGDNESTSNNMCTEKVSKHLDRTYEKGNTNGSIEFMLRFAAGLGGVEIFCIFLVWFFLNTTREKEREDSDDLIIQGYIHAATGFRRFSYSDLKKATRGFKEEIGRGGGGIVYKGTLSDQRVAAIKQLNVANQGEAEFLAEVSLIGKLYHMNLIDMWGYCIEDKHRLLVYEYMEHGSLAKNLSSNVNVLDWNKRFEIAVGTAKGLAYLHEECLEWVLHCDIKPQNILLDSEDNPKIADFGLSKLLNRGELRNFSRTRGTRGYMAPEWVHNMPITSKVDVYSYGIVVLEMLTGKMITESVQFSLEGGGETQKKLLLSWVKEKMDIGASANEENQIRTAEDAPKLELLAKVALQCLEEDKDARPTMSQVVEMLVHHETS